MAALQQLLDDFSAQWVFPSLQLGESGQCQLLIDDKLFLSFSAHDIGDESALMLMAEIGLLSLDAPVRQQTLELLAMGNYNGVHTDGHTLALAPDGRQLVLFSTYPVSQLTPTGLGTALERLTQSALEWQARFALQEHHEPAEPPLFSPVDTIRI